MFGLFYFAADYFPRPYFHSGVTATTVQQLAVRTVRKASPAFWCPTVEDTRAALLALLPRGRAWRNDDGSIEPGSVLYQFWTAAAYVINYANERLCALALEMLCATETETDDQWMIEYGLPDPCDPFPDLCEKVAAIGGQRCEYFNERIARLGWVAECFEKSISCGARAGCSRAGARRAMAGNRNALALTVRVHTGDPPVVTPVSDHIRKPLAGKFRAGQHPSCDTVTHPSAAPIRCLMDRIVPAHVQIVFVT
jgi:uncharacterized protein YmfQ (DUF2313 family)